MYHRLSQGIFRLSCQVFRYHLRILYQILLAEGYKQYTAFSSPSGLVIAIQIKWISKTRIKSFFFLVEYFSNQIRIFNIKSG